MHLLLAALLPRALGGARLHRAALALLHRGDSRSADRLFERAAREYRRDLAVEPLARLRAHQLIARARRNAGGEGDLALEIERCLCRLDLIESLEPPFPLIEARALLASWMSGGIRSVGTG